MKEEGRAEALLDPGVELWVELVDHEVAEVRVRLLLPRDHLELGAHQLRGAPEMGQSRIKV